MVSNEIKNELKNKDLVMYISNKTGINSTSNGKRFRFDNCPFCGKTKCFDVYMGQDGLVYKCLHIDCGEYGDIINFEKKISGCDYKEAVNLLCDYFGIQKEFNNKKNQNNNIGSVINQKSKINANFTPLNDSQGYPKSESNKTAYDRKEESKEKEYDFTDLVEKLHKNLLNNDEALAYFQKKRNLDINIIKKFKLGYCKEGYSTALRDYKELHFKKTGNDYDRMFKYFIPVFKEGKCVNMIVRADDNALKKMNEKINKSCAKAVNIKTLKVETFNFESSMKSDTVYICEGWADALSLEMFGHEALAINTINRINKFIEEIKIFKDYKYKNYVITLDNDNAGISARKELESKLKMAGCEFVYNLYPPKDCKDINEAFSEESNLQKLIDGIAVIEREIYENKHLIEDKKREELEEKRKEIDKASCFGSLSKIMNEFKQNKNKKILSTGFKEFDKCLGGGLYNSLYVIGGISGLGKTTLTLNIAENLANAGKPILFVSLEMSKKELIAKSLSRYIWEYARRNNLMNESLNLPTQRDIQNGNFDENNICVIEGYEDYSKIAKNMFVVEANFNFNTEMIRKELENYTTLIGETPVLIVDYLQVLPCIKEYNDDMKNISFNITELKRISRDFDIPVIVVSSIGRQYYRKAIDFEAFKGSGNIEFTADTVIGLQYAFMDNEELCEKEKITQYKEEKTKSNREIQAVVLKNRNGGIGEITNFGYEVKYNHFGIQKTNNRY